jgi:DNA-binding transcriptional LysR family regulator
MGSLTVGFIGSAMLTVLPALLGKYRMRYPQVELRLRELTTSRLIDAIRQGAVDIGFLRDAGRTDGLWVETVLAERFVVALPETHPLAARKRINLLALQREPLVLFPRELGPHAWDKTMELCETAGFRPKIVQEAPEWLTVLRLHDYTRLCCYDQSSRSSLPRIGPLRDLDRHRARPSERSPQSDYRRISYRGANGISSETPRR